MFSAVRISHPRAGVLRSQGRFPGRPCVEKFSLFVPRALKPITASWRKADSVRNSARVVTSTPGSSLRVAPMMALRALAGYALQACGTKPHGPRDQNKDRPRSGSSQCQHHGPTCQHSASPQCEKNRQHNADSLVVRVRLGAKDSALSGEQRHPYSHQPTCGNPGTK